MKKSIIKYSVGSIVAIIIAMLVIAPALAAGGYLGSFERFKTVIGEEQASLIQSLEISNVGEEIITEDGIRVELVAIGIFDNVVDIYLTFEDMVGNRLDDNFDAFFFLNLATENFRGAVSSHGDEIIDRTDGVITLHSRQIFSQPVAEQELTFTLRHINYNVRQAFDYELNLDLAAATSVSTTQLVLDHDPFSIGVWGTDAEKVRAVLSTTGITVLEPNLHNIDLGIEGIETLISAIGIIDGRLHIQLYEPSSCHNRNSSSIHILNPQGELVELALSVPFSIDEYGNFYIGETYTHYRENIFIVDLDRLSEYSLFGHFHNSELIKLDWAVTFETENNGMYLVVDELSIEHGVSITREMRVNPFTLSIINEIAVDEPSLGTDPEIKIHTKNGIVTTTPKMASRGSSDELVRTETGIVSATGVVDVVWVFAIDKDFLDLDSIISIEIAGEIVELR